MKKRSIGLLISLSLCALSVGCHDTQSESNHQPVITGSWEYHRSPEQAGWQAILLEGAREYFDTLNSAAVVVVYQDRVLAAWGAYAEEYLTHSARKSFMSAMYGIFIEEGLIDPQKTMAELDIDDEPPLTEQERQARVIHLLMARSGVYHTAAAETEGMHDYKPDQDAYLPGEHWCYNNWDFNALVTIFNQETGRDFFECLVERIADGLGMEDFGLDDTQYYYQSERSIHPAYHFQISARDAARFGLLFLQHGNWEGRQIVPAAWVKDSITSWSDSGEYIPGTQYGYMWWIFPPGYGEDEGWTNVSRFRMYAALGAYGQVIMVIPEAEVVFVHRVDSYNGKNVTLSEWMRLLEMILAARPAE
jgi:CubicO group peptidase (beta-lactamase class C family)